MFKAEAFDKDHNELTITWPYFTWTERTMVLSTRLGMNGDGAGKSIAYFRISRGDQLEIHFTRYGRKAGVRNWQARRPGDPSTTTVTGVPPVHTAPRVERSTTGETLILVSGEGRPWRPVGSGHPDDTTTVHATAWRDSGVWIVVRYHDSDPSLDWEPRVYPGMTRTEASSLLLTLA